MRDVGCSAMMVDSNAAHARSGGGLDPGGARSQRYRDRVGGGAQASPAVATPAAWRRTTARISSPNRAIFDGPRPAIRASASREVGRCRSIAAITLRGNTMYVFHLSWRAIRLR